MRGRLEVLAVKGFYDLACGFGPEDLLVVLDEAMNVDMLAIVP